MADEMVDVYNENYKKVGEYLKSEARRKGYWIAALHCWIIRPDDPGYVLFQKRGADKLIYPNYLDISAAGHYKSGESIEEGVREISEEVGLDVKYEELVPLGIKFDVANVGENIVREFCHVFLLKNNMKPYQYSLQLDEVEGLLEIAIPDGLDLFSGKKGKVLASGIEYNTKSKKWIKVSLNVNKHQFIPRVDSYYYKIFILGDLMLRGEKHLAI